MTDPLPYGVPNAASPLPSAGQSRVSFDVSLPRSLTQLIDRENDVASVAALLGDPTVRLLTLTGPGGVGKTRLAIQVATEVRQLFRDGVVFVDLSSVRNPVLVPESIAAGLGLRDGSSTTLHQRLVTAIGDKQILLLLDNFEQVVQAAPRLFDILDACPAVSLLITSRIRLRISGEREYPVAPLALVPGASGRGPDGQTDDEMAGAVRLFIQRAEAIQPDFAASTGMTEVVTEIVRRVDGLPLAIELAAARIKALPPAMLLQRLEQRLPLLTGGARDLPLRQQTMRDTIGWSYDLLDDAERALFRRLSVFVGDFSIEAAESVGTDPTGAPPLPQHSPPVDVIDGITALVEHSLLHQSHNEDGAPRYRMLETVREYAHDLLSSSGELHALQRRHAGFFLAFAEEERASLDGPAQARYLGRIDRDRDNFRAALDWAINQVDVETASRLGATLWRFWERKGYLSEGRARLGSILSLPRDEIPSPALSSVLTGSGVLAALLGDYDDASRLCEEALTGWRQLGEQRGVARTLLCLATVARFRDDYALAEALGSESLEVFRRIDDRWGLGHVLLHLGMVSWVQGAHTAGIGFYDEALMHFRSLEDASGTFLVLLEMGKGACDEGDLQRATTLFRDCMALVTETRDVLGRSAALTELGVVERLQGNHAEARDLFLEATSLAKENGDRRQVAYLAEHLGNVELDAGDVGRAAIRYAEALGMFVEMGNRVGIAHCLEALAECAIARSRWLPAIRILGSCSALFSAIGATPPPGHDLEMDREILRQRVSPAEFSEAWATGQAMSPADAAAEAIDLANQIVREDAASPAPLPNTSHVSPAERLGLTPREIEVLRLLAEGMSDREIANTLAISERTAGNHVQHAMQKIGVESRTAAAVYAVRHNLA